MTKPLEFITIYPKINVYRNVFNDVDDFLEKAKKLHPWEQWYTFGNMISLGEDFLKFEEKKIRFPWNPGQELDGKSYLVQFAIPNFYFHITTAYNILRSSGIELGKADFLGQIKWQREGELTDHP
jgi:hypothetical protein